MNILVFSHHMTKTALSLLWEKIKYTTLALRLLTIAMSNPVHAQKKPENKHA
jgi:hypothetical protein